VLLLLLLLLLLLPWKVLPPARADCSAAACDPTVHVRDCDACVKGRCSVGRMMCAQLPLD
jgi:hypothetical protein